MTTLPLAPRVPSSSDGVLLCEIYRCVLPGRDCINRQRSVFKAKSGRARRDVRYGRCTDGSCAQGKEVRAAFPKHVTAEFVSRPSVYGHQMTEHNNAEARASAAEAGRRLVAKVVGAAALVGPTARVFAERRTGRRSA